MSGRNDVVKMIEERVNKKNVKCCCGDDEGSDE